MDVRVEKRNGKYRAIDCETGHLAKDDEGLAIDEGGFDDRETALMMYGNHADPVGRPTKYQPEYDDQVFRLCLLGATDVELADFFEVEESTINNWKHDHPKFLESLKEGKEEADAKVAQSLYKRAIGYQAAPEVREETDADGVIKTVTRTTKTVGPDTTAAIFWLKNRKSSKWRDKQDLNVSGDGITFNMNFGDEGS